MAKCSRWMFRISVVLLITSLLAPLAGIPAAADEGGPGETLQASPVPSGGDDGEDITTPIGLVPQDPVEIPALCTDGTLSSPDLTFASTPGVTYNVVPLGPWSAGQTITITAQLDDVATTTWSSELPDGWNLADDGASLNRAFTFADAPCDPASRITSSSIGLMSVSDLSLSITGPASAVAGSKLTYTITLTNTGAEWTSNYMAVNISLPDTGSAWSANRDHCNVDDTNSMKCTFIQVPAQVDGTPGTFQFTVSSTIAWDTTCGDVSVSATAHDTLEADPEYVSSNTVSTSIGCQNAVVSQTATESPVSPGETMTFTYTIENLGPGLSNWNFGGPRLKRNGAGWSITDRSGALAGAFCNLYPFASEDGVQCAANGFTSAFFATDTTATMTVSRLATPADCGTTFSSKNPRFLPVSSQDTNAARFTGNDASITVECNPASLAIDMTGPAAVNPGDPLSYTVTLTNSGDIDATGVALSDSLPASGTWTIVDGSPAGCTITGTALDCQNLTVPANDVITVTVTSTIPSDVTCAVISNSAEMTVESVTTASNTVVTAVGCTGSEPDHVMVSRLTEQPVVEPGEPITFTYVVTGDRSEEFPDFSDRDLLVGSDAPDAMDWSLIDMTGRVWQCILEPGRTGYATIQCAYDKLGHQVGTTTISRLATSFDCGKVIGGTAISGDGVQTGTLETVTVDCGPELGIDLTGPATANPGETLDFTVDLTNTSAVPATGVSLTLPLPGTTSTTFPECTVGDDHVLTCTDLEVPAQTGTDPGTLSIPISSTVPTDGTVCGELTSIASFTLGTDQSGSDTVTTTVACTPSLGLTVTPDTASLDAPGTLTLTYTIINNGNIDLTALDLTDNLVPVSTLDCDALNPGTQPTIPELRAGMAITCTNQIVIAQTRFDAGTPIVSEATASGLDGAAQTVASGMVTTTVTIVQQPGLSLLVEPATSVVASTGPVEFIFTITNTGNVTVTGIVLEDGLPAIIQSFAASDPLSLAPGVAAELSGTLIVTQDDLDAGLPLLITSTLTGLAPDQSELTQERTTSIAIQTEGPALTLQKTVDAPSGTTVMEGTELTYHFTVTNNGDVTMHNIVVTDELPGLVWDASNGEIATLAPWDAVTLTSTYTVTSDDAAAQTVVNTAAATGDGPTCAADSGMCDIVSNVATATVVVTTPVPSPTATASPAATPAPATPETSPAPVQTQAAITGLPTTGAGASSLAGSMSWLVGLLALITAIAALGWRIRTR